MSEAIEIELAWAMPVGLAHLASNGKYEIPDHIKLLNEKLLEVADGRCKRLIINLPPRHGKSETISKYFPAWFLGRYPDKRIILTSYEADFAASWGRKVRNILVDHGMEIFGVKVADDSSAANRWDISGHTGGMITAGVGGPITGRGADVLIIDDPIKNEEEANSPTIREKIAGWFSSTAYTRLEPNAAVIIIQTRWHEDDLTGRLLIEELEDGDDYDKIILPAIAEENDLLGREVGEALWPERYPIEALDRIAKKLGSYRYSALYQQHPQPAGGQKFKRENFRYFREENGYYLLRRDIGVKRVAKADCWRFQTIDPAASEKQSADYFVVMTIDVTPDNELLVVDVRREKADTTKHDRIMAESKGNWHPSYQAVESKAFGLNIFQRARNKGYAITELIADTDKVSRSLPAQAMLEAEQIFFLEGAEWLGPFELELVSFPKGEHDDQVDTLSYAAIEVDAKALEPEPKMWYAED
ncbi:MAG: phage terminase large subunit [Methanomassiliicoccales archaeon]|jgi:predicted phage terminase large subunit-like protein